MNYYKDNAIEYINKTKNIDMADSYDFFLKYAKPKSKLLDIGFGSGRDMLYFKKLGFDVYGIDPQPQFVEEAKKKGLNVECCDISDYFNESNVYDSIWACASIHHIPKEMLNQDFKICGNLLKTDGIMYLSVKYGDFEGYDNVGRYFLYQTEKSIVNYLKDTNLKIVEVKITNDNMSRDIKWLNVILRKALK